MMSTRTFKIVHTYGEDDIRATDLREEAEDIWATNNPAGTNMEAGRIEIYEDDRPLPGTADYLYCPVIGRLGIAWGAGATWADVDDLESGIEMWLNSPEEWIARN